MEKVEIGLGIGKMFVAIHDYRTRNIHKAQEVFRLNPNSSNFVVRDIFKYGSRKGKSAYVHYFSFNYTCGFRRHTLIKSKATVFTKQELVSFISRSTGVLGEEFIVEPK
jgi:hypothetical protein